MPALMDQNLIHIHLWETQFSEHKDVTKPARTVAEVCIPGEPEKKSIISPVTK